MWNILSFSIDVATICSKGMHALLISFRPSPSSSSKHDFEGSVTNVMIAVWGVWVCCGGDITCLFEQPFALLSHKGLNSCRLFYIDMHTEVPGHTVMCKNQWNTSLLKPGSVKLEWKRVRSSSPPLCTLQQKCRSLTMPLNLLVVCAKTTIIIKSYVIALYYSFIHSIFHPMQKIVSQSSSQQFKIHYKMLFRWRIWINWVWIQAQWDGVWLLLPCHYDHYIYICISQFLLGAQGTSHDVLSPHIIFTTALWGRLDWETVAS